jgi:hypothetical protein
MRPKRTCPRPTQARNSGRVKQCWIAGGLVAVFQAASQQGS